jgi:hypothetical protein
MTSARMTVEHYVAIHSSILKIIGRRIKIVGIHWKLMIFEGKGLDYEKQVVDNEGEHMNWGQYM